MTNNYDNSSTGININCGIERDYNDNTKFRDSFKRVKEDFFVYTDWGNLSGDVELKDLLTFKGKTKKYLKEHLDYLTNGNDYTKEEIIEEILENDFRISYIEKDIKEFNESQSVLKVSLSKDYHIFTTKGYCQGDCFDVILNKKEYKEVLGIKKINYKGLQKRIDRLCWDTPIDGMITINEEEFLYSEIAKDEYEYNKEELIKTLLKECKNIKDKDLLKQELNKVLKDDY